MPEAAGKAGQGEIDDRKHPVGGCLGGGVGRKVGESFLPPRLLPVLSGVGLRIGLSFFGNPLFRSEASHEFGDLGKMALPWWFA